MTARGFIVSAPRSSSGKTTITLGLLAALARRGVAVRAAKSGPDYIDPAFHASATGAKGINLDTWAMPPSLIDELIADTIRNADALVIEGAMGLFDGVPGTPGRSGAASDLAARLGLPVLLVLDVSGQSQSAAAVAAGFAAFNPSVRVGGVVLNRLGSERHRSLIADALAPLGIPLLGAIPRDETLVLPERHLGLVQASEHADLAQRLDRLAAMAERHLDLDSILAMALPLAGDGPPVRATLAPPGQRIALAADAAFTFVYAHVLDGWRRAGAEIVPFSPMQDQAPPDRCDVCWLPGGYPELHAGRLAAGGCFLDGLRRFAQTRPVHGECGGYMVLGEGLEDQHGVRHQMAGLLGHATSFAKRRLHLHASTISNGADDEPFLDVTDAQGRTVKDMGSRRGFVSGTFFHAIARES